MASVLRAIRRNWKKSLFATGALSYGACYAKDKYEVSQIMRAYCNEAASYGDQLLPLPHEPKRIIVLLNQAANKKSAKEAFENFCEPILHLGGFLVEIIQTDSEGHARRYIEDLPTLPTAILIAGGDGTLFEATTGMLRREGNDSCPIGVLPVGRTNTVARNLFYGTQDPSYVEEVEGVAKATISVVRGHTEKRDAIKIELLEESDASPKPVYAVGALQWGAFRDLKNKRDKYWYTGGLREYSAFLFGVAFSNDVTWECKANILYTDPCKGCQNCRQIVQPQKQFGTRWWSAFIPRSRSTPSGIDYSKIVNPNCSVIHEMEINPTELELLSRNVQSVNEDIPQIKVKIGPSNVGKFSFLFNAWSRVWNQTKLETEKVINVKSVEIRPANESVEEKLSYYSIDNEDFEVKPIRISVVPEAIQMFVPEKS